MGTLPYEYDRVMGVASVGSQESVRFGEKDDSETEDVQDTAAHSREDFDQTHEEKCTYHDANGEFGGGFGYPLCYLPLWGRRGRKCISHDQLATGYEPKHGTEPFSGLNVRT